MDDKLILDQNDLKELIEYLRDQFTKKTASDLEKFIAEIEKELKDLYQIIGEVEIDLSQIGEEINYKQLIPLLSKKSDIKSTDDSGVIDLRNELNSKLGSHFSSIISDNALQLYINNTQSDLAKIQFKLEGIENKFREFFNITAFIAIRDKDKDVFYTTKDLGDLTQTGLKMEKIQLDISMGEKDGALTGLTMLLDNIKKHYLKSNSNNFNNEKETQAIDSAFQEALARFKHLTRRKNQVKGFWWDISDGNGGYVTSETIKRKRKIKVYQPGRFFQTSTAGSITEGGVRYAIANMLKNRNNQEEMNNKVFFASVDGNEEKNIGRLAYWALLTDNAVGAIFDDIVFKIDDTLYSISVKQSNSSVAAIKTRINSYDAFLKKLKNSKSKFAFEVFEELFTDQAKGTLINTINGIVETTPEKIADELIKTWGVKIK